MLPGKGVEQGQTAHEALFVLHLKRVEVRIKLVQGLGNVRWPVGVGTGKAGRRILLVGVQEALQLDAVVADVSDIEQAVLGQSTLDAQEVALDVAVFGVVGDVRDVVGRLVEAGDEATGISLVGGGIAGGRGGADGNNLRRKRSRAVVGGGGLIWVTEANWACGALMARMSPEPARV